MKKTTILVSGLTLLLCLLTVLYKKFSPADPVTDCAAHLVVKNAHAPGMRLNVFANYIIQKKTILVRMEGSLWNQGQESSISRLIYFDYRKKGNSLNMVTKKIIISPADTASLQEMKLMLPLFYLQTELKSSIYYYPAGNGNTMLSTGMVPSVYCLKKR